VTSPELPTTASGGLPARTFGLIDDDTHCASMSDVPDNRTRIVVVEDDCWIRCVLHDVLADEGFAVLEAADGRTALRLIAASQPDLVVLDLAMPDFSGVDVLRSLRGDERTRDLPVVVLSAYPTVLTAQAASSASCILNKPVEVPVLLDALRQALHSSPEALYALV